LLDPADVPDSTRPRLLAPGTTLRLAPFWLISRSPGGPWLLERLSVGRLCSRSLSAVCLRLFSPGVVVVSGYRGQLHEHLELGNRISSGTGCGLPGFFVFPAIVRFACYFLSFTSHADVVCTHSPRLDTPWPSLPGALRRIVCVPSNISRQRPQFHVTPSPSCDTGPLWDTRAWFPGPQSLSNCWHPRGIVCFSETTLRFVPSIIFSLPPTGAGPRVSRSTAAVLSFPLSW
jgi:hypothetical protein